MSQPTARPGTRRLVVVDPATTLSVVAITCVAAVLAGHAAVRSVRPVLVEQVGTTGSVLQLVAFGCYLAAALAAFAVAEVGVRVGASVTRALERFFLAPAPAPAAPVSRSHRRERRVPVRPRPVPAPLVEA